MVMGGIGKQEPGSRWDLLILGAVLVGMPCGALALLSWLLEDWSYFLVGSACIAGPFAVSLFWTGCFALPLKGIAWLAEKLRR